jgi:adenosylmethionine-8-amino-7-oxononanoate aminotransferase
MTRPNDDLQRIIELDHAHIWHPFTAMRQWRQTEPLVITDAQGDFLIDARGRQYIDGVSSLWCNVHGHRVPALDQALRDQLEHVAHTTMLGLTHPKAAELAGRLCELTPGALNKVFYSDSGATATEVAFKMAVGYWYHHNQPQRNTFIAIAGAYHGDTVGSMSVGYSQTFHRPFESMVFHTEFVEAPDCFHSDIGTSCCQRTPGVQPCRAAEQAQRRRWPLECENVTGMVCQTALLELERRLESLGDRVAAVVVEPLVQGAAGIVMHPPGYLEQVARLCHRSGVLLIADEVATGFGRTGRMFACEHEQVEPDLICLGKGITGGYLPLAATLCTDRIAEAFEGELHEHRTLYHGHTYTGNPLGCAAALASLDLFEQHDLLAQVNDKAIMVAEALDVLRDRQRFGHVGDVRQCGLMVGIELIRPDGQAGIGFDPSRRLGHAVCDTARQQGLIIRPLGNVVVLMPPLAIEPTHLQRMLAIVIDSIEANRPAS